MSNEFGGSLSVIDVRAGTVLQTVSLGQSMRPMGLVFSRDGRRLFVTTGRGNQLIALSTDTLTPVGAVEVGQRPWGVALSPDGRYLYTADGLSDQISIVDARSLKVSAHVSVGQRPWGVAIVR